MKKQIVALVATFGLLSTLAVAQTAAVPSPAGDLVDVQAATCAQFARAKSFASPPANPTAEQTAFAETAQDDLLLAMTWLHGYLSGRAGAGASMAFDYDWIVTHMGRLTEVCNANPSTMLLRDAAARL